MKVILQMKGTIHWTLRDLHEKYGPVVRLAPGELSFISARAWQDIYGNRQGRPLPTNEIYGVREKEFFGALGLLWVGDAGEHARHRRVISPAFSDKSLRDQQDLINAYIDLLMKRLHERAGQPVDVLAWISYTTFDLIGDLTFGEPFGCLENSRFHPWIDYILSRLKMMMYGQIISTLGPVGTFINFLVPNRIRQEALDHVAFTKAKVNKRRERQTTRPDFMSHILSNTVSADAKSSGVGITEPELFANSNILIMAGSETTATLMTTAVYYLVATPRVFQRLTKEIRSTFAAEADIDFASASKSQYLLAVINEALRMKPPLPAGINRVVVPEGAVIDGHFVSGGTDLQVPHWACYHNSRNFRDPDRFVPERWLDPSEDEIAREYAGDNRAVFQPFSVGNRNCVGRALAITESRLILSRLLWNFDMELSPECRNWDHQQVFMLYDKKPLMVKMTRAHG